MSSYEMVAKGQLQKFVLMSFSFHFIHISAIVYFWQFLSLLLGLHPSKTKLELQKHLTTLNSQEQASVFEEVKVSFSVKNQNDSNFFCELFSGFIPWTINHLVLYFLHRYFWCVFLSWNLLIFLIFILLMCYLLTGRTACAFFVGRGRNLCFENPQLWEWPKQITVTFPDQKMSCIKVNQALNTRWTNLKKS